jgi:hypothetical protein
VNVAPSPIGAALREGEPRGSGVGKSQWWLASVRPVRECDAARAVALGGFARLAHLSCSRRSSGSHREAESDAVEGASDGGALLRPPCAVRNVPVEDGAAGDSPPGTPSHPSDRRDDRIVTFGARAAKASRSAKVPRA